jgi:hypothetical protein
MNNKDMPAMPTGLIHEDVFNSDGEFCGTVEARYVGLSKREHFAGLAMQGILSNSLLIDNLTTCSVDWLVKKAAIVVDAQLAELDKERG